MIRVEFPLRALVGDKGWCKRSPLVERGGMVAMGDDLPDHVRLLAEDVVRAFEATKSAPTGPESEAAVRRFRTAWGGLLAACGSSSEFRNVIRQVTGNADLPEWQTLTG